MLSTITKSRGGGTKIMLCTNLMGRNFLGCPWRAHDEVDVSHEFVIEHQRVPASEGKGGRCGEAAQRPVSPPEAPSQPGGRVARPLSLVPYLSRSVGWKDCQLALSKLLLLRFWSCGGGGGWALCWSCSAFFLLLAAVAAALLLAMLVLALAG